MAKDNSYITVPTISFVNSIKTGIVSSPAASVERGIDTGRTDFTPNNKPTFTGPINPTTPDALTTLSTGVRRAPAEVQSSGGGTTPDGLGDTFNNGPDNSRLGSNNNGGGTPNF